MFNLIAEGRFLELRDLGLFFIEQGNTQATLLCLDHYLNNLSLPQDLSATGLSSELHVFRTYLECLSTIIHHDNLSSNSGLLRLFGIQSTPDSDHRFTLPVGTFLRTRAIRYRRNRHIGSSATALSGLELGQLAKMSLKDHLHERILNEDDMMQRTPILTPCPNGILSDCNCTQCPRAHLRSEPSMRDYRVLVGLHLQQLEILQALSATAALRKRYSAL